MQFNILNPKKAVQSAVDRPDMIKGLVLVLIPAFLAAAGIVVMGFSIGISGFLWSVVRSVLNWLLLSVILYVVLIVVKGRFISGKFKSIASALSLVWIVLSIFFIVGFVLMPLVVPQGVFNELRALQNGELTQSQYTDNINSIVEQNADALSETLGLALAIVAMLLVAWMIYLIFLVVADLYQAGFFKNAVVTLVILLAWFLFVRYFYFP